MHQVAVHIDEATRVGVIHQVLLPDLQGEGSMTEGEGEGECWAARKKSSSPGAVPRSIGGGLYGRWIGGAEHGGRGQGTVHGGQGGGGTWEGRHCSWLYGRGEMGLVTASGAEVRLWVPRIGARAWSPFCCGAPCRTSSWQPT